MRDRRVRTVFVALILAFPVVLAAVGGGRSLSRPTIGTLLAVEGIVAGGLLAAASERRRLLAERSRLLYRRTTPGLSSVTSGAASRTTVR